MVRTYHDLNIDIRKTLEEAGIQSAQFDARQIISAAAGKSQAEVLRDQNLYAGNDTEKAAEAMAQRRIAGEPLAYVIGQWSFHKLDFFVSKDALIPRVDTEMLANLAISRLREYRGNTRVLDLCTGTGCLGIAVAAEVKTARGVLVDLSDGALDLCRRNIRRHKLTGRVVHLKGDAMQPPSPALGQFDLLVCNPPYIPTGDLPALDPSVKDFEPLLALDGGPDGLDFYRAVTTLWKPALKPGGHLIYEVGINQAELVATLMVKAGYEKIRITRDTGGIDRVVEGQRPQEAEIIPFPTEHPQED